MSKQQADSQNPVSGKRRARRRVFFGVFALAAIVIACVLTLQPFSNSSQSQAIATEDPYALTFDGEDFSGEAGKQPVQSTPVAQRGSEEKFASACASCAKKHRLADIPAASATTEVAEGAPSNAEVEKLAKQQKKLQFASGDKVELDKNGQAKPPLGAPDAVRNVIAAANQINNFPYIWGGGHGSFQARGYDCSGSVSYALKGGGLVDRTMVSGQYENYGEPGPGKWITIYANAGHIFMVVGGVRYDTSFRDGPYGSRWQTSKRPMSGFVVRHPPGL